ncbi:MAG: glycosyltransferase family 39 protein [Candidatus Aureabacteria bacterium]|nr:glycosyltransferase family 39 protein [Candidatus Auribacterota bacterium]
MNRTTRPFTMVFIAGLAARLLFSLMPVSTLIGKFVSDDAYYYFVIARNVARGYGASFDGTSLTNGFHPLLVALLAPLFRFVDGNPDLPVHCALVMLSIFDCLAGYLIYRTLRTISDERGALIGSAFWLLNPCLFFVSLTGTEASLCAFFVAYAILLYTVLIQRQELETRRAVLLGAVTGLAALARSDSIFLLAAFLIGILTRRGTRTEKRLALSAALCITALIVCAPWLLWNLAHFGTIRQVSGVVKPYIQRLLFLKEGGAYDAAHLTAKLLSSLKAAFVMIATSSGVRVTGFIALLAVIVSALTGLKQEQSRNARNIISVVLLYATFIFLFYGLYFWHIQAWYFHSVLMALSIPLGWAASLWVRRLGSRVEKAWGIALAAVMAVTFINGYRHWRIGFYPWQQTYYQLAHELGDRFKEQDRFAAFNAGAYGYYSSVPLINMDGLVNNKAFDAMRQRTLFTDFLRDQRVRYVMDHEYIVKMYWGLFGTGRLEDRLTPVVSIMTPWVFSDQSSARIVIYEVAGSAAGPESETTSIPR